MASYLSQFNYQFLRNPKFPYQNGDEHNPQLRRWVFLHGLMGFGLNWRKIAQSLGPQDICFVFDQRGHGKSIKPQEGYSPVDYAEDLELLRRELNWNTFILVGHSLGGRNALIYANKFYQHLTHLIIEDIGPEAKASAIQYYEGLLNCIPTPFLSKRIAKEWLLNEFLKTPYGIKGKSTLAQYLYANILETPEGFADWRFSKYAMIESIRLGRAQDHWDLWSQLQVPTLIIRGEQSEDLSTLVYEKMLQLQKMAKGVVLPNSGHWAHFDQPDLFCAAILDFVNFDKNQIPS